MEGEKGGQELRVCSQMGCVEAWVCCFQPRDLGQVNLSVPQFLQLKLGIIAVPVREGSDKYREGGKRKRGGVMT